MVKLGEESVCQTGGSAGDYAYLFEFFPQPMWVVDRSTLRFLAVNHAAVRQYGYSRAEFLTMTAAQIETADGARHRTKDGTVLDVELSHNPARFQSREAEIVLAIDVTERRRSERDRSIQYEVARIVGECSTIEAAAPRILAAICRGLGWQYGALWKVDPIEKLLRQIAAWTVHSAELLEFSQASQRMTIAPGVGLAGGVWREETPLWLPEILAARGDYPRAAAAARAGLCAAFGVPIVLAGEILGVMEFSSDAILQPDAGLLQVMAAIGVKIGFYFERLRAEAEIQDSERRFRNLFEESPIAYREMDATGVVRRVNRTECEMLGLSAEQLLGRLAWDLAVPEKREQYIELFEALKSQAPVPECFEVEHIRPNGSRLISAVYPRAMKDSGGNFIGIRSARLDITAIKQAERERADQRRFEALISDVTDAFVTHEDVDASLQHCAEAVVWRLDGALGRIWVMNHAKQVLELRASSGVYTALDGLYSRIPVGETRVGIIADQRQPCLTNALDGDPIFKHDWAEQERLVGFAGYPLVVNDQTVGVLALFSRESITEATFHALGKAALEIAVVIEQKSAEKALRESEQRYRRLVETAAEGICVTDNNGRATFVNQRMGELLGRDPEEVIGRTGFGYVFPEDRELMIRMFASLKSGNRETFDFRLRRPNDFRDLDESMRHAHSGWRQPLHRRFDHVHGRHPAQTGGSRFARERGIQ